METKLIFAGLLLFTTTTPINSQTLSDSTCSFVNQCSQSCTNNKCSCIPGFNLGTNKRSCQPSDPEWKILWYGSTSIGYIERSGAVKYVVPKLPSSNIPVALTFDTQNEEVFWISNPTDGTVDSRLALRSIFSNTTRSHFATKAGLYSQQSLSYDWITQNLYFIEATLSAITVCPAHNTKSCAVVLSKENLFNARSITLHPNLGVMFWIETEAHRNVIYKAGMDGRRFTPIIESLSSISSVAVDQGNARIYWLVENDRYLSSSDFQGSKIKIVQLNVDQKAAHAVAVFGDQIFWISERQNQDDQFIQFADKFVGQRSISGTQIQISSPHIDILGMDLYHPASQPILRNNPCDKNPNRTDLCVLSPPSQNPGYRYLGCPIKNSHDLSVKVLSCSSQFCSYEADEAGIPWRDSDALVIAHQNMLTFSSLDATSIFRIQQSFERTRLPRIESITGISYSPLLDKLILTDSQKIYEYNQNSNDVQILVEEEETRKVVTMNVDEIGGNLFWISDKGILTVISFSSKQKLVLLEGLRDVCDMLIIAEQRSFVVAMRRTRAPGVTFKSYLLDGSPTKSEYQDPSTKGCVTMTYNHSGNTILWSEVGKTRTIMSIQVHPNGVLESGGPPINLPDQENPASMAIYEGRMIWADSERVTINRFESENKFTFRHQILPEGELCQVKLEQPSPIKLVVVKRTRNDALVGLHKEICGTKNCSHVCLASRLISNKSAPTAMCRCTKGFSLEKNGKTCVLEQHNSSQVPPQKGASSKKSSTTTIIAAATASVVVVIGIVGGIFWYRRCRKNREQPFSDTEIMEFNKENLDSGIFDAPPYCDMNIWVIPPNSFKIEPQPPISVGKYRTVQKATVTRNENIVEAVMKTATPGSFSEVTDWFQTDMTHHPISIN